jgi:hypothetical protein
LTARRGHADYLLAEASTLLHLPDGQGRDPLGRRMVSVEFGVKTGPVTTFGVTQTHEGNLKMLAAEGESLPTCSEGGITKS